MHVKKSNLVLAGFLAVFLAGCFNPASVEVSPQSSPAEAAAEPDGYEPFTVSIHIGEDEDRSIAGPDANRIKGNNIRNFIQVIVLNSDNKVVAVAENRRTDFNDNTADLRLRKIQYKKTYKILVLQGHWSRNGFESDGTTYKYVESEPPTLLAAGYTSEQIKGPGNVTISLYPIWMDTKFISDSGAVVEPAGGSFPIPQTELDAGNWRVQWTAKRSTAAGNGFADLITAALGSPVFPPPTALGWMPPAASTSVNLSSASILSRSGNTISLNINQYTNQTGAEGAVNFNLKYVPFSLSSGAWGTVKSEVFNHTPFNGVPEWIIRNGINDAAQDTNTTFAAASKWSGISNTPNGNGAVAFKVKEDIVFPGGITAHRVWYVASPTGQFQGNDSNPGTKAQPLATVQAALTKMAAAYAGAWPGKGTANLKYAGIVILDEVAVTQQITVDNTSSIYPPILLTGESQTAGGKLQAMAAIGDGNTLLQLINGAKVTLNGGLVLAGVGKNSSTKISGVGVGIGSEFTMNGGEISGNSSDNDGAGVSIVDGTFVMNGGEISGNSSKKGGGGVSVAGSGTFTMNTGAKISGNSSDNDGAGVSVAGGGTFTMNGGEISGNSSEKGGGGVSVAGGGTFTMNTGAKISGNSSDNDGGGVSIIKGTLVMNGGEISGNSTFATSVGHAGAGGVFVGDNAAFTMKNGKISGNYASSARTSYGGGVYVDVLGTFTMKDGEISGNYASADNSSFPQVSSNGGGVYVDGTFTIEGGEISGNFASTSATDFATSYGGGVHVDIHGTFTMRGGKISGNSAASTVTSTSAKSVDSYGGGVHVSENGTFAMEGGKISGNSTTTAPATSTATSLSYGGGVYMRDAASFAKTSGTIYGYDANDPGNSNVVKAKGVIQIDNGHAVWAYSAPSTYHKETTVGPAVNLFYNYPGNGTSGDW